MKWRAGRREPPGETPARHVALASSPGGSRRPARQDTPSRRGGRVGPRRGGRGPPPASPPPASPPPATGGFSITLRTTGLTANQQAIFQQAANRWAQVITGDLPNATYNGVAVDDVLIDASASAIGGAGGILGQAGPDRVRSGTYLPYHGTMQFDAADLASLEASGGLYYTVLHEMGHVLGIGTVWSYRGLVTGAGTSNPLFVGAQATAAYNAIFGTNATGVPLENTGGSGTRDSHWRESALGSEVMTGYLNGGVNPLSRVTIASLADLGYVVNEAAWPAAPVLAGALGFDPAALEAGTRRVLDQVSALASALPEGEGAAAEYGWHAAGVNRWARRRGQAPLDTGSGVARWGDEHDAGIR